MVPGVREDLQGERITETPRVQCLVRVKPQDGQEEVLLAVSALCDMGTI